MNPFYCYIFSFSICLSAYTLGWSDKYPELTISLFIFLLITMIAHGISGYFWKRVISPWAKNSLYEDLNPTGITLFIYLLWTIDFVYEGGIPIFKIISGVPYNYRTFGFPSMHVFTVTFASFYTVYLFHLYYSTRNKRILLLYVINLAAALLIYSRAMLFFNIASSLLLFIFLQKNNSWRIYLATGILVPLFFYLFGVMGNLRVSRESKKEYDNQIFLVTGGATSSFKNSQIPAEFFWTYIYLSSPIANLQQNIKWTKSPAITFRRIIEMINNELLFDFISKRTNKFFDLENIDHYTENYTVEGYFNVTTLYSRSFSYLGWLGMAIMAMASLLLPWIYQKILPGDSPFLLSGTAILGTVFLFMAYDNTIRFTGLGFQLVYPLLFTWLDRKEIFKLIRPR